ncbi:HlyD family secretion protein [Mucilaginibacter myungsuensis]|uniref:HlyD family secretion protein n=1 Tax=Mucilaginibacter myungsuensis TaxID=649104 RepID=A0A929PVM2_9SPHI|nr:HlyD family secretion protein [Mucilaginibacter myungsuensis]MBE9661279.1 HlyD family secretion protein [Mucilaginibacter myungsuensis]MDN3597422.1 HlyD family secretion protein [Mucilaginibacter myungsuensis]
MATEQNTAAAPKKKNKVVPIILALVLIGGSIFGIKEYIYYSKHEDTDDAQIDADISPVVARVGGYVDSIYFEDNQLVKKGQVLVKIDDHDYKIKVEQAQAAKEGAGSSTGVNEAQVLSQTANSSSAKAQAVSAQARLEKAEKDYARYANLVKDGSVTQQQFDQAKADRDVAVATYRAAQDQYKASVEQIGATRSQMNVINTGVTQKQVDIDYANLQLSYTTLKAPANGITSKKSIQVGQLVQAGQTLFSVVNENSMYVTANFKETQLEKLKNGQKVDIEVDAFPDTKIEGTVYNFSPATGAKFSLLPPDNATGNFVKVVQRVPVKIKINADKEVMAKLRAGMSVNVSVLTKE